MKKVLILAAALMIISSAAYAQVTICLDPPCDGWLDIFADSVTAEGTMPENGISCLAEAENCRIQTDLSPYHPERIRTVSSRSVKAVVFLPVSISSQRQWTPTHSS